MKREIYAEMGPNGKYHVFIDGVLVSKNYEQDDIFKFFDSPKSLFRKCRADKTPERVSSKKDVNVLELEKELEKLNVALHTIEAIAKCVIEKNKKLEERKSEYERTFEENKKLIAERDKYKTMAEDAEVMLGTYKKLDAAIRDVLQDKGSNS